MGKFRRDNNVAREAILGNLYARVKRAVAEAISKIKHANSTQSLSGQTHRIEENTKEDV